MTLSTFIRAQHEQIVGAFEAFARTLMPAGVNMVPLELRDHAEEMLTAVATDTEGPQTRDEQSNKSKGPAHPTPFCGSTRWAISPAHGMPTVWHKS